MASMTPHVAEIANLVGDAARANILLALMDNRALTAGELAHAERVSPQTASSHLVKRTNAQLLQVAQQGRHRYYRLASPQVAQMLETVMVVAGDRLSSLRPLTKASAELRAARSGVLATGLQAPRFPGFSRGSSKQYRAGVYLDVTRAAARA